MRIGFDVSKAVAPHDGIGNFSLELLQALLRQTSFRQANGSSDWELHLFSPLQAVDSEELRRGLVEVGLIDADSTIAGSTISVHGRAPVADDALDLFHSNTWCFPERLPCPVLFTCYDLTFLSHPECHTVDNRIHCATGLLRAHLGGAHFVAISQATSEELQQRLDVDSQRIDVIYPAAASRFRRLDSEEAKARLKASLDVSGDFLLAVGTLEPRKNLRRLLTAYGALPQTTRQRYPLLLAGAQGWEDATSFDAFLETPELATVRRLGHVSNADLVDLYNATTLFVYPSLAEGFGLPILEAMGCGAPVMTSSGGATAEVAKDAAYLVDPLDASAITAALDDLLQDAAKRQRLSERGNERASEFSWQQAAQETLKLYHRLASADQ